jgi:ABC-2 type transport system permease protein
MSNTTTIAGRQFRSYFNSAVAYIVLCLVMLALGFWFWKTFFLFNKATSREMFDTLRGILAFAIPAMTMGLLAEEKRTGTIELLITMPVRDAEVVVGKFLGVLGLFGVLLLLTLPYPLSVATLGPIEWGPVFTGYFGLFLQGAAMMAIGLMTSSFTDNQLIALFSAMAITVPLAFLHLLLPLVPTSLASIFEWFSFHYHFDAMARGVLDLRNVLYFLSLTAFSLMVAFRSLESRRWS